MDRPPARVRSLVCLANYLAVLFVGRGFIDRGQAAELQSPVKGDRLMPACWQRGLIERRRHPGLELCSLEPAMLPSKVMAYGVFNTPPPPEPPTGKLFITRAG